MENPYQSPEAAAGSADPANPLEARRRSGLVQHVRVVAILMIVQGALELLAGLGLAGVALFLPVLFRQMQNQPHMSQQLSNQPAMWIAPLLYGGMAAAALAASLLHLMAGFHNYRFRGRTLGIVALAGGMLTVATCYCLPTAVALCVYGLIVYLNREASEAFYLGEEGRTPQEIFAAFPG